GDESRLIANHLGDHRRLRVVDDGALLVVDPARPVIDRRADQRQAQDRDPVDETAPVRVEPLALPGEPVGQLGDDPAGRRAVEDIRGAAYVARRQLAGGARAEYVVELVVGEALEVALVERPGA